VAYICQGLFTLSSEVAAALAHQESRLIDDLAESAVEEENRLANADSVVIPTWKPPGLPRSNGVRGEFFGENPAESLGMRCVAEPRRI
jgi:hypothetical protein